MSSLPVFVGLDYHQDSVQVCVLNQQEKQLGNRSIPNNGEAIQRCATRHGTPQRIAIEACCGAADLAKELVNRRGLPTYRTDPKKCHVSHVVGDTEDWEQKMAQIWEDMREVIQYVKNDRLGFTIPYTLNGQPKNYTPDFIVHWSDGHDDPLQIIVEVSGNRPADADELRSGGAVVALIAGWDDIWFRISRGEEVLRRDVVPRNRRLVVAKNADCARWRRLSMLWHELTPSLRCRTSCFCVWHFWWMGYKPSNSIGPDRLGSKMPRVRTRFAHVGSEFARNRLSPVAADNPRVADPSPVPATCLAQKRKARSPRVNGPSPDALSELFRCIASVRKDLRVLENSRHFIPRD